MLTGDSHWAKRVTVKAEYSTKKLKSEDKSLSIPVMRWNVCQCHRVTAQPAVGLSHHLRLSCNFNPRIMRVRSSHHFLFIPGWFQVWLSGPRCQQGPARIIFLQIWKIPPAVHGWPNFQCQLSSRARIHSLCSLWSMSAWNETSHFVSYKQSS